MCHAFMAKFQGKRSEWRRVWRRTLFDSPRLAWKIHSFARCKRAEWEIDDMIWCFVWFLRECTCLLPSSDTDFSLLFTRPNSHLWNSRADSLARRQSHFFLLFGFWILWWKRLIFVHVSRYPFITGALKVNNKFQRIFYRLTSGQSCLESGAFLPNASFQHIFYDSMPDLVLLWQVYASHRIRLPIFSAFLIVW